MRACKGEPQTEFNHPCPDGMGMLYLHVILVLPSHSKITRAASHRSPYSKLVICWLRHEAVLLIPWRSIPCKVCSIGFDSRRLCLTDIAFAMMKTKNGIIPYFQVGRSLSCHDGHVPDGKAPTRWNRAFPNLYALSHSHEPFMVLCQGIRFGKALCSMSWVSDCRFRARTADANSHVATVPAVVT